MPSDGHVLSVLERGPEGLQIHVVESETSAAHTVGVPATILASPVYEKLRGTYGRLVELTGSPPFVLKYGEQYRGAITETLRWLDEAEIKWSIPRPINRDAYIKFLVTRA